MSPYPSWPSVVGDHHGASRSKAIGATTGRLRSQWTAATEDSNLWWPLIADGVLVVGCGEEILVFDPEHVERGPRAQFASNGTTVALFAGGILTSHAESLTLREHDGRTRWVARFSHEVSNAIVDAACDTVLVHTIGRDGFRIDGAVACVDTRGTITWTVSQAQRRIAGLGRRPILALDDRGILYTVVVARLGDGVSGDDVQIGGLAAYDTNDAGRTLFTLPPDGWMNDVYGRTEGAIVTGRTTRAIDAQGNVVFTTRSGAPDGVDVDVTFNDGRHHLVLTRDLELKEAPLLQRRTGPGSFMGASPMIIDGRGNIFACTYEWTKGVAELFYSVTGVLAPRFAFELPLGDVQHRSASLAIGVSETTVLAYGSRLYVIE